ncbi:MAG TPA: serine hydrolase domain-containing protein [Sandaracinaceae bacterium]
MIEELARLLDDAVATGHPPAACACVLVDGEVVHESAHGDARTDSVFDVASVTKIATTMVIAREVADGALELDAPAARWLGAFAARGKGQVTVRELLGHRSGLPAWAPLFVEVMRDPRTASLFAQGAADRGAWSIARELVLSRVFDAPLERSGRRVYSDLGFLALGALAEKTSSAGLDALARDAIFAPLGLADDLGFADLSRASSWLDDRHVLPTGRTRPREPAPGQEALVPPPASSEDVPGRVDDDNAFAMGGVAGHAGLFGTARGIATLGACILDELEDRGPLGLGEVLRAFVALDPADGPPRGLGFDRPAPEASSAGALLGRAGPRGAIGHLGFTGCSLWVDLDRRLSVALLTNRTYPGRRSVEPIRALRPAFHDALCRAVDGAP